MLLIICRGSYLQPRNSRIFEIAIKDSRHYVVRVISTTSIKGVAMYECVIHNLFYVD
jgi:hypothetical protein